MKGSVLAPLVSMTLLFPSFALSSCASLSSRLPGKVLFPGATAYTSSVSSYFYVNQRQAPACVVAPTTADEVAEVIKLVNSHAPSQVAIRSGGHSPNADFSNVDHGVTIDLRGLNQIEISKTNTNIVSLGTGALWVDVSNVLDPLNRAAIGSRVASVGVGGFITGGGISFSSPQYGFSCDHVQNMEVVLANGTITNANATSNTRLFRALKGGQNNFGIVTRFDVVTYPQPPFWGGAIQYPESADAAQLAAFTAFKKGPYDPFSEIEQTHLYIGPQKTYLSSNGLFYTKSGVNQSNLRLFTDIQPQIANTARMSQASDFAIEMENSQPKDQYASWSTFTFPITDDVLTKVHTQWKKTTASLATCHPNISAVLSFQSVPPPPAAHSLQNSLPFASSSTPQNNLVLALISFNWPKASESKAIESAARKLADTVQHIVGDSTQFKYLNYAGAWQDPISAYGKAAKEELRQVAKLYDPNGFFQNYVTGFKLY
ncbi:FAD-binding domain-containing protein [Xylaria sp. FL1777]|nr:FAD-binding domain-containing protein [Xylaria sp. FL1777]